MIVICPNPRITHRGFTEDCVQLRSGFDFREVGFHIDATVDELAETYEEMLNNIIADQLVFGKSFVRVLPHDVFKETFKDD